MEQSVTIAKCLKSLWKKITKGSDDVDIRVQVRNGKDATATITVTTGDSHKSPDEATVGGG